MTPYPWGLLAVGIVGAVLLLQAGWARRHRRAAPAAEGRRPPKPDVPDDRAESAGGDEVVEVVEVDELDEVDEPGEVDEADEAEELLVIDLRDGAASSRPEVIDLGDGAGPSGPEVVDLGDGAGPSGPEVIDLTDGHLVRAHGFSFVLAPGPDGNARDPAVATRWAPTSGRSGTLAVADHWNRLEAQAALDVLVDDLEVARARVATQLSAVGEGRDRLTTAREELAADLTVLREELRALGRGQRRLLEAIHRAGAAPVTDVGGESPQQGDALDQRLGEAVIRALRSWNAAGS